MRNCILFLNRFFSSFSIHSDVFPSGFVLMSLMTLDIFKHVFGSFVQRDPSLVCFVQHQQKSYMFSFRLMTSRNGDDGDEKA